MDRNFQGNFCRAFDVVDHGILLSKLHHYGVRGLPNAWLRSYLSSRQQCVVLDGKFTSSTLPVTHGVPQGSVIGSLLFLVFINDLPNCTEFFKMILFADDSTLACRIPRLDVDSSIAIVNSELTSVQHWLNTNKMKLNIEKTKYVLFSYRSRQVSSNIRIGDGIIERVPHTKFLGAVIDENLNFKHHVSMLASNLSKTVGILKKINMFIPKDILIKLYYLSLIHI